jgi:hypothetical protein
LYVLVSFFENPREGSSPSAYDWSTGSTIRAGPEVASFVAVKWRQESLA